MRGWGTRWITQPGARLRRRRRTPGQIQGSGVEGCLATPSRKAASSQGLRLGGRGAGGGVVSRMNRSTAAITAAASSGEAFGATIVSCGRRFTGG